MSALKLLTAAIAAMISKPVDEELDLKTTVDNVRCKLGVVDGVEVSTVRLPTLGPQFDDIYEALGGKYETCIFYRGQSQVMERYKTREDAIQGHEFYCNAIKDNNDEAQPKAEIGLLGNDA